MRKLGAAIIGCGAISPIHAKAIIENEKSDLVCVVDINEDKGKKNANQYNCDYYKDYKKMLKDSRINVVHICTPHYLHGCMTLDSVRAGKHVIVEKPVALNFEETESMIKKVKNAETIISVAFQNRLNPTSVKVKEILGKKELGKILGIKGIVTWMRDKDYYLNSDWRGKFDTEGGGLLINQTIHTLDLIQWFGGGIMSINGHVDTRCLGDVIEVEDTAEAVIKFDNGSVGLFYGSNCYSTNSPVEMEVHCEKGTLTINQGQLILYQNGEFKVLASDNIINGKKAYWGVSHKKLINNVYEAILNKKTDYITVEEASIAMKMIKGIYESSKTNKPYYF